MHSSHCGLIIEDEDLWIPIFNLLVQNNTYLIHFVSVTLPELNWPCISLCEVKIKGKTPPEQGGTEKSCTKGEKTSLGSDFRQTLTAKDFHQSIKTDNSMYACYFVQIFMSY